MTVSDSLKGVADDVQAGSGPKKRSRASSAPVAASAHEARAGLRQQLEDANQRLEQYADLESKLENGALVQALDPVRVRHSRYANRLDLAYQDDDFQSLVADVRRTGGNEVVAKVRPLSETDENGCDFEIVYGHRRHAACVQAEVPFRAVVEDIDDGAAIEQAVLENSERLSMSAYEEALQYRNWVEAGVFTSYNDLSQRLGIAQSGISQRKTILGIPESVRIALGDPRKVSLRGWRNLSAAYKDHPDSLINAAEVVSSGVYEDIDEENVRNRIERMIKASNETDTNKTRRDDVSSKTFSSPDGSLSMQVKTDSRGRVTVASKTALPESVRSRLEQAVTEILNDQETDQ